MKFICIVSSVLILSVFTAPSVIAAPAWATGVHNLMILTAFPNESFECILEIEHGSEEADSYKYQQNGYAHMHAMREKAEPVSKATQKMWTYVDQKFAEVKNLESNSRTKDACYIRGMALHPIMDATSPAHRNFSEWDPIGLLDLLNGIKLSIKLLDIVRHGDADGWIRKYSHIPLHLGISEENMDVINANPELLKLTVNMIRLIDQIERQAI